MSVHDVIIIGAGCSGISAARECYMNGAIDTVVLEGRDRIGGRLHKAYLTKNLLLAKEAGAVSDKVVIQLGANWIHGLDASINPLYKVACELGIELFPTSSDDDPSDDVLIFDKTLDGYEVVDKDTYSNILKRYGYIKEYIDESDNMCISIHDLFLEAITYSETLLGPSRPREQRCLNWLLDRVSIDLAAPVEDVSNASYMEGESDGKRGEALVHGGYFEILNHLAIEYPLDIRLNHVVKQIITHEESHHVEVKCTTSDGALVTFIAKRCLVTVPLGVLQSGSIEFLPSTPVHINKLCDNISSGLMNLIWLWFPYQFWPNGYNFFGVARDTETQPTFSTFLAPTIYDNNHVKQPILMCQVFGKFGEEIESMTDKIIAERATEVLKDLFGPVIPNPVGCMHSTWLRDPFSRGSWSYIDVKNTQRQMLSVGEAVSIDFDNLNELDSLVYYAGEAMSKEHRGTAHGAYVSGRQEAARMLSQIGKKV